MWSDRLLSKLVTRPSFRVGVGQKQGAGRDMERTLFLAGMEVGGREAGGPHPGLPSLVGERYIQLSLEGGPWVFLGRGIGCSDFWKDPGEPLRL